MVDYKVIFAVLMLVFFGMFMATNTPEARQEISVKREQERQALTEAQQRRKAARGWSDFAKEYVALEKSGAIQAFKNR